MLAARDLVEQDPSAIDGQLSWLRRCREAQAACFFNSTAVTDECGVTSLFKACLFLAGSLLRQNPTSSSVLSRGQRCRRPFY